MKWISTLLILASFILTHAQTRQKEIDSLCSSFREDTDQFISTIERLEINTLPDDILLHYARILSSEDDYLKAESIYRLINSKKDSELVRLSDSTLNYWLCREEQIKTETQRELRNVLIVNKKYLEALELISQDKITYLDIHANTGKCIKPWLESKQKIDSARCLLGLHDTIAAIDILFYDQWFREICFDSENHLKVLLQTFDSTFVFQELHQGFKNPFCSSTSIGSAPNRVDIVTFKCVFFGDTVLTGYNYSDYQRCSDLNDSIRNSVIKLSQQSYYYQFLLEKEFYK